MPKDEFWPDYVESYQQGQNDWAKNKPKSANPYDRYSTDECEEQKHKGWKDGWAEAEKGNYN